METERELVGEGSTIDTKTVHIITHEWIKNQMKERQSEFTDPIPLNLFCGTWNVNNKSLNENDASLEKWLLQKDKDANYDIYAIGFQEIVELNPMNVTIDGSKSVKSSLYWQEKIFECLDSSGVKYTQVASKHLVGILLFIFVKESLTTNISDVVIKNAAVGAMGVMGNKGGISCSLKIFSTYVCFVCAHLAAKRDNVKGRNADFHEIIRKTSFTPDAAGGMVIDGRPLSILDHEIVFWLGDLNYRIDEILSTEEVFDKVTQTDLPSLLQIDQLNVERAKGNAFRGFLEGEINFLPTYKFQQGTDVYERRKEKKLRAPAWCDRVLWKSHIENDVTLLTYASSTLNPSDHKPVLALFGVTVRELDVTKEAAVKQEVMRMLDRWENRGAPKVELSWTVRRQHADPVVDAQYKSLEQEGSAGGYADVGLLMPMERVEVVIRICNVGKVLTNWFLVPKATDGDQTESTLRSEHWLAVTPVRGMIPPEESVEVVVAVFSDLSRMHQLRKITESEAYRVDEVLIIRIDKGRDFFVPVSADLDLNISDDLLQEEADTFETAESVRKFSVAEGYGGRKNSNAEAFRMRSCSTSEAPAPPDHFVSPLEGDDDTSMRDSPDAGDVKQLIKQKALDTFQNLKAKTNEATLNLKSKTSEAAENLKSKTSIVAENLKAKTSGATQSIMAKTSELKSRILHSSSGSGSVEELSESRPVSQTTAEKLRPVQDKMKAGWSAMTAVVSKRLHKSDLGRAGEAAASNVSGDISVAVGAVEEVEFEDDDEGAV